MPGSAPTSSHSLFPFSFPTKLDYLQDTTRRLSAWTLPVFSYSYFTVSSDGCWMHGFSPWVLQQARSSTIIPISQMRKQSLTNLRTLNSPTQLLSGGVEWKLSDLTLELSLGCPSHTLDCELNLANVCGHLDSTPSRERSPAGPHALLEFVHSAPSVCPLIALITYARHQRFVFLSVSPTSLGNPRADPARPSCSIPNCC